MEIKVNDPVRFYCSKCGYSERGNPGSYPCKCPGCGSLNSTSSGFKKLSTNCVYRDSTANSYNFANPSDKSIQFYFRSLSGKHCGMTLDIDYADEVEENEDNPIQEAKDFLSVYTSHYLGGGKNKIIGIIDEMELCEKQSKINHAKNMIEDLTTKINEDYSSLLDYMEIVKLDELDKPTDRD